jgi:hypothetical protein
VLIIIITVLVMVKKTEEEVRDMCLLQSAYALTGYEMVAAMCE